MGSSASKQKRESIVLKRKETNRHTPLTTTTTTPKDDGIIRQYVQKVTNFSSQYDDAGWKANYMVGPPSVYPSYGDIPGTWAQGVKDSNQFVELQYEKAVYVTSIDIYETYYAGGVVAVKAMDTAGSWQTLWKTDKPQKIIHSRIFSPKLQKMNWKTNQIRIEVDCSAANNWVELDTAALYGKRSLDSNEKFFDPPPPANEIQSPEEKTPSAVTARKSQWVSKVTAFSSQYNDDGWSANQVIGPPKVYPRYGDHCGSWAQAMVSNIEFLELEFAEAVYISAVDIYETYHSGGVVGVLALDDKGTWQYLWKTNFPSLVKYSRIFFPPINLENFKCKTKTLRIEVDCSAAKSWVEIDAVHLHSEVSAEDTTEVAPGVPPVSEAPVVSNDGTISQWVYKVTKVSSEYDLEKWPATTVIGEPKVYPKYGDIPGAWAPSVQDDKQFLELEFKEAVFVTGIDIYETYHAGGVVKVHVMDDKGNFQVLWKAEKPSVIKSARIFKPKLDLKVLQCATKTIRLDVDCMAAKSWVEIDAVQLHGTKQNTDMPATNQRESSILSNSSSVSDEPELELNDKTTSDCMFVFGGTDTIYAHRDILCTRSDYFIEMFMANKGAPADTDMVKKDITDASYNGFMGVLHYIYHSQLPETHSCIMLIDVWKAADQYKMAKLKTDTEKEILKKTDVNNVIEVYKASTETYPVIESISNYCKQFMEAHMQEIVNAPGFTSFPHEAMAYPY